MSSETAVGLPALACVRCGQQANGTDWHCRSCGGPLDICKHCDFDQAMIDARYWSMQRYAAMLPVPLNLTLGEGGTPLVRVDLVEVSFLAKLEFLSPTGSCKDRGSAMMINHLRAQGAALVVEDSSGNAGASLAAYAGAAEIRACVFVPEHTAPAKKRQIRAFGAEVVEVPGDRTSATEACLRALNAGGVYASHAWNPFFLAGQMTCAWEIWEQLGGQAPDVLVCPIGQGNLLLGLWRGYQALQAAGLIDRAPRLLGVQSAACAPIVQAWEQGLAEPPAVVERPTLAEGLRVAVSARGREVLEAIRASNGLAVAVEDDMALAAQTALAHRGILVEVSSAVAVAGLELSRFRLNQDETIVVPLSGSGLKGPL